jgi:type VII secretion integral membrane protein EccD
VTVVGTRRRVDVAVPTTAPIGEYVAGLADLCGQGRRHPLPHAWSLALAGEAPLSLDTSLGSCGVTDGQVLYLRDLARDPASEPVVEDVGELVTEGARAGRDAAMAPGLVIISFGLLWLVATALVALRHPGGLIGTAVTLILAGLGLLAGGWSLDQRQTPVPAVLRLLMGLTAIPCLAVAGALVASMLAGGAYAWCGAVAGANVAGLMALAATPEAVLIALEIQLGAAALASPLLIVVHANRAQTAATTVLVALAFLGVSKMLAAAIAAWAERPSKNPTSMAQAVTELLIRSRRLLTVVIAGPAVALAISFILLAASGGGLAIALAGVAGVGLLVRARQRGFTNEVVLIGGAGLVGLFGTLMALMNRYAFGGLAVVAIFAVCGLALVAIGAAAALLRREPPPAPVLSTAAGTLSGMAQRPDRHRFIDVIGVLCHLASVSLVLGVFGVFHEMVGMGRAMVG